MLGLIKFFWNLIISKTFFTINNELKKIRRVYLYFLVPEYLGDGHTLPIEYSSSIQKHH